MDLYEKYRELDNFEDLENELLLNKSIFPESFKKYILYHSAKTPFEKWCVKGIYTLHDMNVMNDIEAFREEIKDEDSIQFEDFTFSILIYENKNFEIFKYIVDNFHKIYNEGINESVFLGDTVFTVEKLNYLFNSDDVMDSVDLNRWFLNIIRLDKNPNLIDAFINKYKNFIYDQLIYMIIFDIIQEFEFILSFLPNINEIIESTTILERTSYFTKDNRKFIKILLEKGAEPYLFVRN